MAAYFLTYIALFFICIALLPGRLMSAGGNNVSLYKTRGFRWNPYYFVILLIIGVIAGSRGLGFGTDYEGYYIFYDYILQNGDFWSHGMIGEEIGYQYINLWAGKIGIPGGIFFGALSAATWYLFIKGSYRYQYLLPLMFFFAISTGYLFWTWSGIRQSIAIMIFFFSIMYIIEGKPLRFVALISFASLFHMSVLAMLLAYFVKYVKYSKILAIVLYITSIPFAGMFSLSIVTDYLQYILGQFDAFTPYARYLNDNHYIEAREVKGTNLGFLLKSSFTIWIILLSDRIIEASKDLEPYIILFVGYAVLSNVFFSIELAGRLIGYLLVCFPIVAAASIRVSISSFEQRVSLAFLMAFFLLYLVTIYRFTNLSLSQLSVQ